MTAVKHVTTVFTPRRLVALTLVVFLCAFSIAVYWTGTALSVAPAALRGQMAAPGSPTVIDVRFGFEYRRGHLPGAINLPLHTLLLRHEELALARDKPLVVYCGTGPRACLASFILKMVGFTTVYVLDGQLGGWRDAGFPLAS